MKDTPHIEIIKSIGDTSPESIENILRRVKAFRPDIEALGFNQAAKGGMLLLCAYALGRVDAIGQGERQ